MVTVLDTGLIQSFDIVFPFVLVWAIVFALLHKTGVIGSEKAAGINAAIATAAAFMVLLSRTVIDLINFMLPWFTVAIIFFVLLILIFKTFGLKDATLESVLHKEQVYWAILGVVLVIMIAGLASVFGQSVLEAGEGAVPSDSVQEGGVATGDFQANIFATLFHPKVLGLIIIFTIAIFAVALLSG